MKIKLLSVVVLALVLSVGASAQTILAGWTYNDTATYAREKNGNLVYYADQGLDENVDGKFIAAEDTLDFKDPNKVYNPVEFKNDAANYTGWDNGKDAKLISIQFYSNEATDLTLAFKIASGGSSKEDNRAPKDWKVQIEDGDNWIDLKTIELTDYDYKTVNIDLPASYSNLADKFSIRWIMTSNDAVGGSTVTANGTLKLDSVIVAGMNPVLAATDVKATTVSVYPNPATDVVYVTGANAVEIINAVGFVVKSVVGETSINVADLNAGIYFVKTENTITKLVIE